MTKPDKLDRTDAPEYTEALHRFLQLHRYLRRYAHQVRRAGISGRKVSALRYLLEVGPRTVGQLSDYLFISDSTVSEMVAQLEEAGYVSRQRCQNDQRVVWVDLMPDGRAFAEGAPLGGIPLLRENLRKLPAPRLAVINDVLGELVELLEIENGG
jgi:DNA-binding MarR family transcriptional regulator